MTNHDVKTKKGFIYQIKNIHNGELYIGYSTTPSLAHVKAMNRYQIKNGYYSDRKLYTAMRLYGSASFAYSVLEYLDITDGTLALRKRCKALQDELDTVENGLNDSRGKRTGKPKQDNQGSNHPLSKLTEMSVSTIKLALRYGIPVKVIADAYGVSDRTIYQIKNNKTWKHVEEGE